MTNKIYQNQKRTLKYSKKRIDKAGREIRHGCSGEDRSESIKIIQNFREAHLYPLMLLKNHLFKTAKRVSKTALVARRLKRLPTIIGKLERPSLDGKSENAIKLTRMQDIGGCRAIVKNLNQLTSLLEKLTKSKSVHKIIRTDNYLTPKESGYGGVHIIYSCFENADEKNEWTKTKIEIQLRTELQHAWATSLEIIDTLENVNLKTSLEGHEKWRRFFKITGMLVAHKEKACELTEDEVLALTEELNNLESKLEVRRKIFQYKLAIDITTSKTKLPKKVQSHQGLFLVTLKNKDIEIKEKEKKISIDVTLRTFSPKETDDALTELALNEGDESIMVAVLVSAGDVRNLKKAYPNYFGSTGVFSDFITKSIKD